MSDSLSTAVHTGQALWEDLIPAGFHWSAKIRRGTVLRFTAQADKANLSTLLFNAEEKLERYNMPDSLKAQHTAFLSAGHVCYSDMGRILAAIVRDDTGWADAFCGVSDAQNIQQKYGSKTFDDARNGMYRNGRDGLLVEMGKWGLGKKDLVTPLNLFSKVTVDESGRLQWQADHCKAGDVVELRFEMDCLVMLSTAPHPLDTSPTYSPAAVKISAFAALPVAADDLCRSSCEQNGRGYQNNQRYFAGLPQSETPLNPSVGA